MPYMHINDSSPTPFCSKALLVQQLASSNLYIILCYEKQSDQSYLNKINHYDNVISSLS